MRFGNQGRPLEKLNKLRTSFRFILSNRKLLIQLSSVSVILSLPIFYLIYSSYFTYNESYQFASLEISGVAESKIVFEEFDSLIRNNSPEISAKTLAHFGDLNKFKHAFNLSDLQMQELQAINRSYDNRSRESIANFYLMPLTRFLGNNSKLILDPDIDSYYLADILLLKSPRIFEVLVRDSDFISIERFLKQVESIMVEVNYSLSKVLELHPEDQRGVLALESCFKDFSNNIDQQLNDHKLFSPALLSSQLMTCNKILQSKLVELLNLRNEKLLNNYLLTLRLTILIWLIGSILGFYIYLKIIQQQLDFNLKIVNQEKKIFESEKLKILGELASSIVHEIKNPLTLINHEANAVYKLIEKKDFDQQVLLGKMSKLLKMYQRINKISNMITIYTRNSQNDPFEEANSLNIIEDSVYIVNLKAKGLDVRIEYPDLKPVSFFCRPYEIEQVLINLLNNSIDVVAALEDKWIKISTEIIQSQGIDWLRISVVDSGNGIPKEIQDKLFVSFFTTKKPGHGTGLGLSVSLKIVESHKGKLYYDPSSANTKFVLEIPLNLTKDTYV